MKILILTLLILTGCIEKEPVIQTPEQIRQNKIDVQFNQSGAHIGMEKIVELVLHDPDSYQHISTKYKDEGNFIMVSTKFRAKNGFGGIIVDSLRAKYDLDGVFIKAYRK